MFTYIAPYHIGVALGLGLGLGIVYRWVGRKRIPAKEAMVVCQEIALGLFIQSLSAPDVCAWCFEVRVTAIRRH